MRICVALQMHAAAARRATGINFGSAVYRPEDERYPGARWHKTVNDFNPGLLPKNQKLWNNMGFQNIDNKQYQQTMRKQNQGIPYPYWNVPYKYFAPQPTPPAPHMPPAPPLPPQPRALVSRVSRPDTRCVICQFLVQRIRAEVLINGLGGGMPFGNYKPTPTAPYNGFGPKDAPKPFSSDPGNMYAQPGSGSSSFASVGAAVPPAGPSPQAPALVETDAEADSTEQKNIFKKIGSKIGGGIKKLFNKGKDMVKNAFKNMMAKPIYAPPFMPRPAQYVKEMPARQRSEFLWKNKRERNSDVMVYKPTQARYSNMYEGPLRNERRAQERYENNQMYAVTFNVIDDICSKRMPKPFYAFCGEAMKEFQFVARGLRWNERPDAVCQSMNMCGPASYVQRGPHAVFRDQ